MKNHTTLFKILLIVSGVALGLLLSPARLGLLAVFALAGGFYGWLLSALTPPERKKPHAAFACGFAAAALVLLWLVSRDFGEKWSYTSAVVSAAGLLHLSLDTFLQLGRGALALASLPAVAVLLCRWLLWLGAHIRCMHRIEAVRLAFAALFTNHFFKRLLRAIVCVLCSALCGLLLLALVYLLPVRAIDENVARSAPVLAAEGESDPQFSWCTSYLDNFTDSYMLLESAYDGDETLLDQVLLVKNDMIKHANPYTSLVAHYIDGKPYDSTADYARYWHGYLIFLKPLLEFMTYSQVRVLNTAVQLLLTAFICGLLKKKCSGWHAMAWGILYLMLMPVILGKSLQYSTCFYTLSFGSLALLMQRDAKKDDRTAMIFLFTGVATAYFDFLTYPIATFGVPAVVWLALTADRPSEQKIASGVRFFFAWCVGYGGMWASKWVIASLLSSENVIADAVHQVVYRTSDTTSTGEKLTVGHCIMANMKYFFTTPATVPACGLAAWMLLKLRHRKPALQDEIAIYLRLVPYSVVGLFPFLWYAGALNHSSAHAFFANKACVVFAAAVLFALADAVSLCRGSGEPAAKNS